MKSHPIYLFRICCKNLTILPECLPFILIGLENIVCLPKYYTVDLSLYPVLVQVHTYNSSTVRAYLDLELPRKNPITYPSIYYITTIKSRVTKENYTYIHPLVTKL